MENIKEFGIYTLGSNVFVVIYKNETNILGFHMFLQEDLLNSSINDWFTQNHSKLAKDDVFNSKISKSKINKKWSYLGQINDRKLQWELKDKIKELKGSKIIDFLRVN